MLFLIRCCLAIPGTCCPGISLAFWAITVRSNISAVVPIVGKKVHFLMLGGNLVNANALLRFYVLHCVILPLAAVFFIAIHFWRIRKDGGLYSQPSDRNPVRTEEPVSAAKEVR